MGRSIGGLWTIDDALAQDLTLASHKSGDKIWRMPLEFEYKDMIESKIADVKNVGNNKGAGAIVAALFLQNFVHKETSFAHIDMAGPAWNHTLGGATGYGVKLLTEYILSKSSSIK